MGPRGTHRWDRLLPPEVAVVLGLAVWTVGLPWQGFVAVPAWVVRYGGAAGVEPAASARIDGASCKALSDSAYTQFHPPKAPDLRRRLEACRPAGWRRSRSPADRGPGRLAVGHRRRDGPERAGPTGWSRPQRRYLARYAVKRTSGELVESVPGASSGGPRAG